MINTIYDDDNNNDDDDDDDDDNNDDDAKIIFIVLFAISVTINLLICIIISTCYLRRIRRK